VTSAKELLQDEAHRKKGERSRGRSDTLTAGRLRDRLVDIGSVERWYGGGGGIKLFLRWSAGVGRWGEVNLNKETREGKREAREEQGHFEWGWGRRFDEKHHFLYGI